MSNLMDTARAPSLDDQTWIEQLKRGDELAWEILIARFAHELRDAIGAMLRKRDLGQDLLDDVEQETWRTVVRKIRGFVWQGDEKLRRWLHSIARHHVQTYQRITRQQAPSMDDLQSQTIENDFVLDLFLFANGLVTPSAEDEMLLIEYLGDLDAALLELKPRDREILLATLLDHTDRAHLAQRYQVEEDTISMIVWRCKAKLRGLLKARQLQREDNHY